MQKSKMSHLKIILIITIVFFYGCSKEDSKVKKIKEALELKKSLLNKEYQKKLELKKNIYAVAKKSMDDLNATDILVGVIDSSSGEVLAMVDVLNYADAKDKLYDLGVLSYIYEPGSVISPLIYAIALENNRTTPSHSINCYQGKFKIDNQYITDVYKFDQLSAEDVLVYSSNIGISQIGLSLGSISLHDGLKKFSMQDYATYNEKKELIGTLPGMHRLENNIYRATISYGYGLKVNLMQLIRAYSVFNNGGIDNKLYMNSNYKGYQEPQRVISTKTASQVQSALKKAFKKSIGVNANTKGFAVGGKISTAHMVENAQYVNKYNTSIIGYANKDSKKYVLGILVVDPKKSAMNKNAAQLFEEILNKL